MKKNHIQRPLLMVGLFAIHQGTLLQMESTQNTDVEEAEPGRISFHEYMY